jgi:small subunit ribosomal protein S8
MSMTDPIADLLTRIRNGSNARKEYIECQFSHVKEHLARVMIAEGFLRDVDVVDLGEAKKGLRVWIRYDRQHQPVIQGIRRISRPSHRVYVGAKSMPSVRRGMGVNILSTPAGIMADREATRMNVGGELLCSVW